MASPGDKTSTFSVDDSGSPEPVTVRGNGTREIVIYENALAATTDYNVYRPDAASSPVQKAAGTTYTFRRSTPWSQGAIVGYVETVSGTATFAQEENE